MTLTISRAAENDCDIIAQILVASWRFAYKGIMPDNVLDNLLVEQRSKGWQNHLKNGGEAYLLTANESAFGLVEVCPFRDKIEGFDSYGEIPVIYLMPDKIGQGFGRVLMEFALDLLAKRGFSQVGIWVLEKNKRAINFYEDNGFSFSGHTKKHGTGLVEWLMVMAQ